MEQVPEDEVGFDEPPVLLQDIGQVVLARIGLQLADEERGRDVAELKGAGHPQQVVQARLDVAGLHVAGEVQARIAQLPAPDTAELLVADVAQTRRVLQSQQVKEPENQVRVAVRVGSVLDDDHVGFVAQHLVQHVGRVALGGGDDLAAVLA